MKSIILFLSLISLSSATSFWSLDEGREILLERLGPLTSEESEEITTAVTPEVLPEEKELPESWKGNEAQESFSTARRLLEREVFGSSNSTIYCGCEYVVVEGKTMVDFSTCGFFPKDGTWNDRDRRVEWEHVLPASHFGKFAGEMKDAWENGHVLCETSSGKTYKGRRCAEKVSREFRLMQADMHNLWPAMGSVNGLRSDRQIAEISGETPTFGTCDAEFEFGIFEPRDVVRGEMARTYLYMEWAYGGYYQIPDELRPMLTRWVQSDPVSPEECRKESRIAEIQGNSNPFVRSHCEGMVLESSESSDPVSAPDMVGVEQETSEK